MDTFFDKVRTAFELKEQARCNLDFRLTSEEAIAPKSNGKSDEKMKEKFDGMKESIQAGLLNSLIPANVVEFADQVTRNAAGGGFVSTSSHPLTSIAETIEYQKDLVQVTDERQHTPIVSKELSNLDKLSDLI